MPIRYRSAITGEFVSKLYANNHRRVTVGERYGKPKSKPKLRRMARPHRRRIHSRHCR